MSAPPDDDVGMTFWEHLAELRSRLLRMGLAFLAGSGLAWFYRESLMLWITTPLIRAWSEGGVARPKLILGGPAAAFIAYVKLSLLGGFLLASPIIFYQLWAFVAPGLYAREKRFTLPFVASSSLLFAAGGYFGWRIAFPTAFAYLLKFGGDIGSEAFGITIENTIPIGDYIEFITRLLIAFGAVFELPVLVFFLSVANIINHRHLIRFARYFVVIAFVIAAVLTPPDVLSQFLLAVPLCLLYVFSIGIAYIFGKKDLPVPGAPAPEALVRESTDKPTDAPT